APTTPGQKNSNGDLVGTNSWPLFPQLQPLGDYGGPTHTLAPFFDSIVVNMGDANARPQDTTDMNWNLNTSELIPQDQAGNLRVSGGSMDLGAYEYQFPDTVIVNPVKIATENKIKRLKKRLKKLKGKPEKIKKIKKRLKKLQKKLKRL
ncbi:MAG: choice-of-anchor Q domain-containing protein, partial [Verrucomicrobiota bacterium]